MVMDDTTIVLLIFFKAEIIYLLDMIYVLNSKIVNGIKILIDIFQLSLTSHRPKTPSKH